MDARDYSQKLKDLGLFERIALRTNSPEKLIKLVRTHENRDVRRLAMFRLLNEGLEKLSNPDEREAIVQIALHDSDYSIRLCAVEMISLQEHKDIYLKLIDECESILRDRHSYSNYSSRIAANSLEKLYKKLNLSKEVSHTDCGTHKDYHTDGPEHQDSSHPDYNDYNGCGDYMYGYGSGHVDYHVDEGHEDYYRIIE